MRTNKEVLSEIALTEDMHDNPSYWAENYLAMEAKLAAAESQPAVPKGWIDAAKGAIAFCDNGELAVFPATAEQHIRGLAKLLLAAAGDKP